MREGLFKFTDVDKDVYNLRFKENKLVEVLDSPGVSEKKLKKIKEEGLNFWNYQNHSSTRMEDAKNVLEYLDNCINNSQTADLKYIRDQIQNIVENRRHRIENIEIFALIQWKLTILNDIDEYLNKTPLEFKLLHDEEAKVEPKILFEDLIRQAKCLLGTLRNNVKVFDEFILEMQSCRRNIKKLKESFIQSKETYEMKFEDLESKIVKNDLINVDDIGNMKNTFNEYFMNFQNIDLEHEDEIESIIHRLDLQRNEILKFEDTYKEYGLEYSSDGSKIWVKLID